MDVDPINPLRIGAQAGHGRHLLVIAGGHKYKMAGTGYHLELRFHWQLASQGISVLVGEHQPVVFAAVQQHRHMHIGQGLAAKAKGEWTVCGAG